MITASTLTKKKVRRCNFYICDIGEISDDEVRIHQLNDKIIKIQDIKEVKLEIKKKRIVEVTHAFFTLLLINYLMYVIMPIFEYSLVILSNCLALVLIRNLKKEYVECNILFDIDANIHFNVKKNKIRKAKLFIKKIYDYQERIRKNDFYEYD